MLNDGVSRRRVSDAANTGSSSSLWAFTTAVRLAPVTTSHLDEMKPLHYWERLFHHVTRRYMLGVLIGITIMLIGACMATHAHYFLDFIPIPHAVWDAIAYFLHGVGAIPILERVEPLWAIFTAAE